MLYTQNDQAHPSAVMLTTVDYTLKLCAKINAFFLRHLLVDILSQRRDEYKLLYKAFEETSLSL